MANREQLKILKKGVEVWNNWRDENPNVKIDLTQANLIGVILCSANFSHADLGGADLSESDLRNCDFYSANIRKANLSWARATAAKLNKANLFGADLSITNFSMTDFSGTNLARAKLYGTNLTGVKLDGTRFLKTKMALANLSFINFSATIGLDTVVHELPSSIDRVTISNSIGKIPEIFLRGCGLSDWEIESTKLYNPDLTNEEISAIQYKVYDLRATQSIQISPLFISYSRADSVFVDKIENYLIKKGVRFWRDIHDMKSGRMEIQVDRAMRLNPTVLLILSKDSLQSDWVEHEVRTAHALEREMKRDVLCPVALDDSWKNSPWSKRILEQIMEYNILDFSEWKDDTKFENTFNKLIDGLGLFYK